MNLQLVIDRRYSGCEGSANSGAPSCDRKYDVAETWREMRKVGLVLLSTCITTSWAQNYWPGKGSHRGRTRNPQNSVLSASRGITILEILLAAVPALEVPVWLRRLSGLGLRFMLLVRKLVSNRFQPFGFLHAAGSRWFWVRTWSGRD